MTKPRQNAFRVLDDIVAADVSPGAKVVAAYLWLRADAGDGTCYPSVETIARSCKMTRRPVQKALRELEAADIIRTAEPTGELRARLLKRGRADRLPRVYTLNRALDPTPRKAAYGALNTTPRRTQRGARTSTDGALNTAPKPSIGTPHCSSTKSGRNRREPTNQQLLFKAIEEIFGDKAHSKKTNKRIGALARDFEDEGADPTELRLRAERYRKAWPNIAFTARGVLNNWHLFAKDGAHGSCSGRTNGHSPARVTASADKRSRYAALTG